ncbi:MAG TPA: UDP-N-acetylmuramoyl-tripeptide--D-alanyl-D-alanine ligase [Thermodesulfovibrionales bacterium]|nr:UDP-N-acetylmuramoyl-tripeptide--D-alanyl-D-alanine ligase [Thermodesulfovibrionales bacterium]
MAVVTTKEILSATGGRVLSGRPDDTLFAGISIDSRNIGEGELFIALRGQTFDGHHFLADAMKKGSGAVVSDCSKVHLGGKTIVCVKDTLKALHDIARSIRLRRRLAVAGITGTNGKTTTKELAASILGMKHRVMKNPGNLNNRIGLPLSLTRVKEGDEFAVLEMGASMKGDILELCDIALPDYGVITNIGPGHLEGFGDLDTVRKTKLELLDAVKMIVLNADDCFLMEGVSQRLDGKKPDLITFGIENSADVYARDITLDDRRSVFDLCVQRQCVKVAINVSGRFNIYNALAAAALCHGLGLELEDIKSGIELFKGVPMRLELKELFGATVLSDAYNANPVSMEEAVRELVRQRKKRAVAVLGDMLELGAYADEAHRKLGRWMAKFPVDVFVAVGGLMAKAAEEFSAARQEHSGLVSEPCCIMAVPDSCEAEKILPGLCREGDTVLVKGSRAMHMEKVLENGRGISPECRRDAVGGPVSRVKNAL